MSDGGENLIEETNPSGGVVARYAQGLNIDEPLAMLRSSVTNFYLADGLGSVTSLSNGAGALAQTYATSSSMAEKEHVLRVQELLSGTAGWPQRFRIHVHAPYPRDAKDIFGTPAREAIEQAIEYLTSPGPEHGVRHSAVEILTEQHCAAHHRRHDHKFTV